MTYPNEVIIIICEGPSERAYLQQLNRILREKECHVSFNARLSNGGDFSTVKKKFRQERKNNKKAPIFIWVDFDLYKRNDKGNKDKYENRGRDIPEFLFSKMNFEDVLILHFEKRIIDKWIQICKEKRHFNKPLFSDDYLPLFKRFYKNEVGIKYNKGDLPFDLDEAKIMNIFKNSHDKNIPFESGLHQKLFDLFSSYFVLK